MRQTGIFNESALCVIPMISIFVYPKRLLAGLGETEQQDAR